MTIEQLTPARRGIEIGTPLKHDDAHPRMPSASAPRRSLQHRNWIAALAVAVFIIVALTLGI